MTRPLSRKKSAVAARLRRRLHRLLTRERELWAEGYERVAGVDEAGVGPLAGPVVAGAVIFPPGEGLKGVDDSKRLTAEQRANLAARIRERAAAWAVAEVDPPEIDRLNIYRASLEAMRRALARLSPTPDFVLIDGRGLTGLVLPHERVIGGDAACHAIAAASILAKERRDELMAGYESAFPGYGFAEHKGYPTESHRAAIRALGPCPIHRRSFTLLPHPRLFD